MTQVLRYPYEAITDSTDYLQITTSAYTPAGDPLIRNNLVNQSDTRVGGTKSGSLYAQTLNKTGGVILLPMPSNIQDGNSVSYADDSLDTISAKLAGGAGTIMKTTYNDNFAQFGIDIVNNANVALKNLFEGQGASEMKDVILKNYII